ncbi:hypothetical protein, partial [Escherichia coli]|uniref:hypothetical protein n=1 Tax=Escherichia coli TaxID=562 RepID=UPI00193303CB
DAWGPRQPSDAKVYGVLARSRSVLYTPAVACSLRLLRGDVGFLIVRMDACIGEHLSIGEAKPTGFKSGLTELLIVDEAERLSTTGQ